MPKDRRFPLGASAASTPFVIQEVLRGEAARGMYRATDENGRRALVTLGTRQTRPHAEARAELSLPVGGVARLVDIGRVEGGAGEYDALIEEEPAGDPVSALGAHLGVSHAIDLVRRVGEVLAPLHAEERALVYLRPELIYVERGLTLDLQVTGIAPRAERFLESAVPPSYGVPPMFEHLYLAPEVVAGGARTPACDVFSLAVMLAQWATGRHPFGDAGLAQMMAAIATGRRQPWTGPERLGAILDRALQTAPARRPSLDGLLGELRGALPN